MQTHYGDMAKDKNEYMERNKGGSDSVTLKLKRYEMEEVLSMNLLAMRQVGNKNLIS